MDTCDLVLTILRQSILDTYYELPEGVLKDNLANMIKQLEMLVGKKSIQLDLLQIISSIEQCQAPPEIMHNLFKDSQMMKMILKNHS